MNSDASVLMGYLRLIIIIVCVCVFVYVYFIYNMEHSVTLAGCSPMYFGFFLLFRLARLILHYTLLHLNSTQSCTKIARLLQNICIYNM